MFKNKIFIYILFFLLLIFGCGKGTLLTEDEAVPDYTAPTFSNNGVTGGTFSSSDSIFTATVAPGIMPAALDAHPQVTKVTVDGSKFLVGGESLISNQYELDLNSNENFITTSTVNVTMTFNTTSIPADKLKPPYVYVRIYSADEQVSLPVIGSISGSTITLTLKGLTKDAVFSVVYNPSARGVLSDSAARSSSMHPSSTQAAPWQTNKWYTWYDSSDPDLRTVIAGILNVTAASLTDAQIETVVKSRIANNAAYSGSIYQAAGYRAPNLKIETDSTFTGTTDPVFMIYLESGGSKFMSSQNNDDNDANILGFSYGILRIDPDRMDDTSAELPGTVLASVSHEMLHSIQNGYDVGASDSTTWTYEGTATPYGITIDKSATEPQVRTWNNSEIMLLSTYLGCPSTSRSSYAYAHQDFFAYVARAYNSNSLGFVEDYYAKMKTDVDAQVTAGTTSARVFPTLETLLQSLNSVFSSKFGKDLPTIYFDFVKKRAMEHSVASELRAGEPAPMTLNSSLFHKAARFTHSVNPEDIEDNPVRGTITKINPFSSRVIVISATKVVDGITAYLTLTPTVGSIGSTVKAVVYRNGVGTEMTGSQAINDFGSTSGDKLTILVSNVDYDSKINLTYTLGGTPTSSGTNTFQADVVIDGTTYDFSPNFVGAYLGDYGHGGPPTLTNVPSMLVTEGNSWADVINKDLILILSNPNHISSSGGTYAFTDPFILDTNGGYVQLEYTTPQIVNVDDGDAVGFDTTGGSITFTRYGSSVGDRLIGTFTAYVSGNRTTSGPGVYPTVQVSLHGTITGSFDVEIASATVSSTSIRKKLGIHY